jgi:hypothetical protein
MQNFQRNRAIVLRILRQIDSGHTATPELPVDSVKSAEGFSESIDDDCGQFKSGLGKVRVKLPVSYEPVKNAAEDARAKP